MNPRFIVVALVCCSSLASASNISHTGQTGIIAMPDARIGEDGEWTFGGGYSSPYSLIYTRMTLLPRVEVSGRYTTIRNVPSFAKNRDQTASYGDYKDKAFDLKVNLLSEAQTGVTVSAGLQDFLGTKIFDSKYLAASKKIADVDLTAGYGSGRIGKWFGGVQYNLNQNWSFLAEFDANQYPADPHANLSGAIKYSKGINYGLAWHWGWLNAQLNLQHGNTLGGMGYVNVPLGERDFIPKLHEPLASEGGDARPQRPTEAEWQASLEPRLRLQQALYDQDFRGMRIDYVQQTLRLSLGNNRVADIGRAVARAARLATLLGPVEARRLEITYSLADLPVRTYHFSDMALLNDYFLFGRSKERLQDSVTVDHPRPEEQPVADEALLQALREAATLQIVSNENGHVIQLKGENGLLSRFSVHPSIGTYFNDPSGALKYELYALGEHTHDFDNRTQLESAASLTLLETVSDVTQPSNSQLPHVRSDVAEYKQGGKVQLRRLALTQYYTPAQRWYAKASAGIYEEMFAGAGGQLLYQPAQQPWTVDWESHWVKQRSSKEVFGFRDYQTVTSLMSLNYRLPLGLTATARVGRFLAKDSGVRIEMKRRFRTGVEAGVWYTVTDGHDTASPGSPSSPYNDKGVFLAIPLNILLTKDTAAVGSYSLSPWSRDVGQMLMAPGDLYGMLEKGWLPGDAKNGRLWYVRQDPVDELNLPDLGTSGVAETPPTLPDLGGASHWLLAGGLIGAAAMADNRVNDWSRRHDGGDFNKAMGKIGKTLPIGVSALSAWAWLESDNPRLTQTASTSLFATAAAAGGSLLLKPLGKRRRPDGSEGADYSFPSTHSAAAWAALTPYALEYDAPMLYGVAALSNLGRISDAKHWLSDTVAGAAIGYGLGRWIWQQRGKHAPDTLAVTPEGVVAGWKFN